MSEADGVRGHSEKKTLSTRAGILLFAGGVLTWVLASQIFGLAFAHLVGQVVFIESKDGCHIPGIRSSSSRGESGRESLSYSLLPGVYEMTPKRGKGRSAPLVVYGGDMDVTINGEGCQPAISPTLLEEVEKHGKAEVIIFSD